MGVGDYIEVSVRKSNYTESEKIKAEVLQMYGKYCVLSYHGLYRFCASYGDIDRGDAITL